jgi:hypothetical protein
MSRKWPANTVFRDVNLEVEERTCPTCQSPRSVESRRVRRIFTCEGPVRLICQLCHCSNPDCPEHQTTVGPEAELTIAMPYWVLGWDVFCWLGHRRFARHWSVTHMRHELKDRFGIALSGDAIEQYVRRYQQMVAARQHDPDAFRTAYQGAKGLVLSIDGLQPEKGHETLYVVREIGQKRVWFAQALLSNTGAELKQVFERAKTMADELGVPVRCWVSDKQNALVRGIAQVFPGVPHRYCDNHFVRDLAKPMLEADSNAKVQMRKKVRGLRSIEQAVEAQRAAPETVATTAVVSSSHVVQDYCAAVRGILNDNKGGPLHPPGERMAQALIEVREAIVQNPEAKKGGPRRRT